MGSPRQKVKKGFIMQKIVRYISLDFQRRCNARVVYATQSDLNYRVVVITLYNDGVIYPIHPYSGEIAAINVLRPDGRSSSFPATVTGVGEVTYEMTSWPVGIAGDVQMSLSLYTANGDRLSTAPFTVQVAEGLYLGSQIEEDEENQTAFANMMAKLADVNLRDELREAGERVRKSNEEARELNETRRQNAEGQRNSAEEERDAREQERDAHEQQREEQEIEREEQEIERDAREQQREEQELTREENELARISNEEMRCRVTDAILEGLDNLLALQEAYIRAAGGIA